MKTATDHPFPPNPPYRILAYPSGDLLAVELEGGQVLMDLDQAKELLRILTVAVPVMEKEK